jgi:RNA polymerase sigma-70 factor, ECF subfamily
MKRYGVADLAASPPRPSDAEALAELARGQIRSLGVLYDRYHHVVYRFVAVATNRADDAEDLVHATFLTAAKAARSFDGRADCRPWLLGIAARLVHRRRRTLARFGRAIRELTARQPPSSKDPHRDIIARDQLAAVARALAELNEFNRAALLLAEVEGLTGDEIAAALGVPLGTVWRRLHDARRALRKQLLDEVAP